MDRKAFGKRIGEALNRNGWTQEQLADRVRIGRTSIVNMIAGRQVPRIDALIRLSRVLRVRIGWLLGEEK